VRVGDPQPTRTHGGVPENASSAVRQRRWEYAVHTRPTTALTLAGAQVALAAALDEAASIGGRFNVAVTDAAGDLLAFARMDGAFAESGLIAIDKCRTVVRFGGAPTDGLYDALAGEDAVVRGIANRPGIAAFGGGVGIVVDGELVGAVGASGGSAAQDRQVAAAGAAAIAKEK
jgi:Uncharacterized protein, possibly involved in utilization of glycolate and propanediol